MLEILLNLNPREKVLVSLLAVLILLTGLYRLVLEKQITAYQENKTKLAEIRQQLADAEEMLAGEKLQRQRAKEVEAKLASVRSSFNTQVQSGGALVDLSWQADQAGVVIEGVKPMPAVPKKEYLEIPFTLKISGQYNNIMEFVKILENLPNTSEIRRADFSPVERDSSVNLVEAATNMPDWVQSGKVEAALDLVIFSEIAPEKAINRADKLMESWAVGRANAFQSVDPVSPTREINISLPEIGSGEKDSAGQ